MNYSADELKALGLGSFGENVRIHKSAVLINPAGLQFGNNVRVDCFCVFSAGPAGIRVGDYVHVAAGCYLFGGGGPIVLEDFSGLSSRVSIYTATDDYTEGYLTNPTVPDEFKKVTGGAVFLRKHVIIGAGSVILPGVELGIGSAVGALTCVRKDVEPFKVVVGNPARAVGERGRKLLELEQELRKRQPG